MTLTYTYPPETGALFLSVIDGIRHEVESGACLRCAMWHYLPASTSERDANNLISFIADHMPGQAVDDPVDPDDLTDVLARLGEARSRADAMVEEAA